MEGNWNGALGQNKYQYNGKEWNDDFGYNINNFGFRDYDASTGRWWNVDPLSDDDQESWNPYHYSYNSPIVYIDLYGLSPSSTIREVSDKVYNMADNMTICPTCPKTPEFDKYRESKDLFTFNKECNCVLNGDGVGVTVTATRLFHGADQGLGHTANRLGNNDIVTREKFRGSTSGTSVASTHFREKYPQSFSKTYPQLYKKIPKRVGYGKWSAPLRSPTIGGTIGRSVPLIGRGLVGVSVVTSAYNIATAENKIEATVVESVGLAGSYGLAETGFTVGLMVGGVPGAIIGGIAGGALGYLAGTELGQEIYNNFK